MAVEGEREGRNPVENPEPAPAEEQLRLLLAEAQRVNHDVNNALSTVVGFAELLLERPGALEDRAQVKRYLELIRAGGEDAIRIVSALRKFYRSDE